MTDLRIAFFGSPAFALPSLEIINQEHHLALVISQPDKPAGRGLSKRPPPVAIWASRNEIPLLQPKTLKTNSVFRDKFIQANCDVAVTVAYGKILPENLLQVPPYGFLNAHASLLPSYRGAAPIQWALINGDTETGISIMSTEIGLDTGPVRLTRSLPIGPDSTSTDLFRQLSELSAKTLTEALTRLDKGNLPTYTQDHDRATFAPLLTRDDGRIYWDRAAQEIYNRYRGGHSWPGSWCLFLGRRLKIHRMSVIDRDGPPGKVLAITKSGVIISTGSGAICLEQVKPEGKATMSAMDWCNGYGVQEGAFFA